MHPAVRRAASWYQPAVSEPPESSGNRPGNPRAGTAEHRDFQPGRSPDRGRQALPHRHGTGRPKLAACAGSGAACRGA